MTITTYTDLGLRLQTEVAELKVSLEKEQALTAHHRTVQVELLSKVAELKAEHIAYISRTGARILALHDELGELKAKLAETERRYPKSALETHPMIPNPTCKCEHWQRCEECTPSLKGTP